MIPFGFKKLAQLWALHALVYTPHYIMQRMSAILSYPGTPPTYFTINDSSTMSSGYGLAPMMNGLSSNYNYPLANSNGKLHYLQLTPLPSWILR
jgi:hypothetical protein